METAYKYPKCTDCVHAHMDKNGNHDCGFMDCVSEQDKEYPDETTFESYLSCYDCLQKYVSAERRIAELETQIEKMKSQYDYAFNQLCKSREILCSMLSQYRDRKEIDYSTRECGEKLLKEGVCKND